MDLPTFEQARDAVANHSYTAVEWFICEHEPSNLTEVKAFRNDLSDALEWTRRQQEATSLQNHIDSLKRIKDSAGMAAGIFTIIVIVSLILSMAWVFFLWAGGR